MRTSRGLSRLVGFSDGVVAIAITLLILPLVDKAGDFDGSVGDFLVQHQSGLFVFLLSFVVIGNFWFVHHTMYEQVGMYSKGLMWANLLWLLSIVFLPFPTELLAQSAANDTPSHILYVGTMVVTTGASFLQQWIIVRNPELQLEELRGTPRLLPSGIPLVLMMLALVVTATLPAINLWALLLLTLSAPIERLISRRKARS